MNSMLDWLALVFLWTNEKEWFFYLIICDGKKQRSNSQKMGFLVLEVSLFFIFSGVGVAVGNGIIISIWIFWKQSGKYASKCYGEAHVAFLSYSERNVGIWLFLSP